MSIRSRIRQLTKNPPRQVIAACKVAFHGDKSDFMVGERVLCRQQPGGKWTIMRYKPDMTGFDIPQMDVMVDVPGECLQF
jgi:hypothetical protein